MKVLVIGSGASGLGALKSLSDEGINDVICYESEDQIGGLWRFTEQETHSSVYRSTIINTSKEMMCFTDYPIPAKYPPFMSHEMIIEYFNQYADHFNLKEKISLNTRVEQVKKNGHDSRYTVTSLNRVTNERKVEQFDAVMVCSGHHWKPNLVSFPGQSGFKGRILHSHSYKDQKGFEGKNVVVVGVGNSGVDVAVELSRYSKQVHLVTRSGTWLANRLFEGYPADMAINRRISYFFPYFIQELAAKLLLERMNAKIEEFGLKPTHSPLGAHPTINGELIGRISVGAVIVKPNIKEFQGENSILFEDGSEISNVDVVILCTGYEIDFPFLDSETTGVKIIDNNVELFKYVIPPPPKEKAKERPTGTLSFIGLIQPWGAIMPISEMQSRWVARILSQKQQLPTSREMWADIEAKKKENKLRYKDSKRHTIQVDYVPYMDELAKQFGAYPHFWKIFFKYSPLLALKTLFGPGIPSVYRLLGPGTWAGAPEAINQLWERNFFPTRTRLVKGSAKFGLTLGRKVILLIIILIVIKLFRGK